MFVYRIQVQPHKKEALRIWQVSSVPSRYTVFDLISGLFAYAILGEKRPI